eukprot:7498614-Pyramimonas_sp.AAC.2
MLRLRIPYIERRGSTKASALRNCKFTPTVSQFAATLPRYRGISFRMWHGGVPVRRGYLSVGFEKDGW